MRVPSGWPGATYRVQFHAGFGFRDAAAITPYLRALGVTHVYASPYLMAAAGSTHGYDVVDHSRLNPELGSVEDFEGWLAGLRKAGMSHILDTVPNHAGVATNANPWWNDVLEHGPAGKYGDFFDISWRGSPRPQMHDRVLLPVLGAPYGQVLEAGELQLRYAAERGRLWLHYYERAFPLDPRSYGRVLTLAAEQLAEGEAAAALRMLIAAAAELPGRGECEGDAAARRRAGATRLYEDLAHWTARAAGNAAALQAALVALQGKVGEARSFDALDALLQEQCYRLAYWRIASDEINYRRFFDINDLAAVRMELEPVFDAVHALPLELIGRGELTGLRIDHPDGLLEPEAYLRRLQAAARQVRPGADEAESLYVTVEKILAPEESLRPAWPVAGTSGYDFLNKVSGLFVDPDGEAALTRIYGAWIGERINFHDLAYAKKRDVVEGALASELTMLTHRLDLLAQRFRGSRDFTLRTLRQVLAETVACFPIYRTYITGAPVEQVDRAVILEALHEARRRNAKMDGAVFDYLQRTLLLEFPETATKEDRAAQELFVARFQQLTAPVMAKGVEDTAFYLYHRLVSLNEVGGEPTHFGVSADALHAYLADRAQRWPFAMSALSTHDTKRSEDVRARLHVLSEIPEAWEAFLEEVRPLVQATGVQANDSYLLLQTLLGVWPREGLAEGNREDFVKRVQAYMEKALREGKVRSSWTDPQGAYEGVVAAAVAGLVEDVGFLRAFLPLEKRVAAAGRVNSLAQTALRLFAPGVPDTYQGTEIEDLSLVDPDNRRPVDYARRAALLGDLPEHVSGDEAEMLRDGRLKLMLIQRGLRARREWPGLFTVGAYVAGVSAGEMAGQLFAFGRQFEGKRAVVAVPRLAARRGVALGDAWEGTRVTLPGFAGRYVNLLTGEAVHSGDGVFDGKTLFGRVAVGVFLSVE